MKSMSLESIMDEVREKFDKRDEARERVFELTRNAIRLSASAIKAIHRREFDLAEDNISKIRRTLNDVVESLNDIPELLHSGMVNSAFQEYSEAALLMLLTKEGRYAPPAEISVPFIDAYILGLADLIGELRRSALDSVCSGDVEQAVSILGKMDEVLSNLVTLDYPEAIIPGLRHKCDVARNLVEKTRGDIANSVSNQKLVDEIKKLNEKLRDARLEEQ
jgi:translin